MPVISRFYGIVIKMYFQQVDHNPPHIHVLYGEYNGVFEIESLSMVEGDLPKRAIELVKEWLEINQQELLQIWKTQNFKQLNPLQ